MTFASTGNVAVSCVALLLLLCTTFNTDKIYVDAAGSQCTVDTDCFPANCCHSSICVSKNQKELCDGKTCSTECIPFTMDCGGKCTCNPQGYCAAQLNNLTYGGGGGTAAENHKHKRYTYIHVRVKGWPKQHGG
jgi:hypothetical protein